MYICTKMEHISKFIMDNESQVSHVKRNELKIKKEKSLNKPYCILLGLEISTGNQGCM